jgi:hypothetical protein
MTRADIFREIQELPRAERFEILESLARLLRQESQARPLTGTTGRNLMAAAQALDFRGFTNGRGVQKAHEVIRRYVEHLDEDRPLYPDHNQMKSLVKSGEILDEVEKAVGGLE